MRSLILPCLVLLSACVSPVSDFPAPPQTDTTSKTPSDTTKKPPTDTTKKTPPPDTTHVTPTASAALSQTAQVVKGWGMYPAGGAGLYGRPQVAQALYASGITFIRVAFVPQLYVSGTNVNDIVLDQSQLAILVQALQYGQSYGVSSYIASVWSPPASMKTNNSLNGGSLRTDAESTYVAYLTKIIVTLHAAGMPLPTAVSIQNEPEHLANYSSDLYTVAQWQRVIIAARAAFNANGLSGVTLFGPETGTFSGAIWSDPYAKTPGFLGGGGYPSLANAALDNAVG